MTSKASKVLGQIRELNEADASAEYLTEMSKQHSSDSTGRVVWILNNGPLGLTNQEVDLFLFGGRHSTVIIQSLADKLARFGFPESVIEDPKDAERIGVTAKLWDEVVEVVTGG